MKSGSRKRTVFTSGIIAAIAQFSSVISWANADSSSNSNVFDIFRCEIFSIDEFSQLNSSPEETAILSEQGMDWTQVSTAEFQEELIHAEDVSVCFDSLGIRRRVIPLSQKSAGIENL